ncbi:MAG: hypothetical protein IT210_26315 [Armatimonadetes bacterium]|nr:hypothetical protein [Armatimonadota bacterium]
MAKLDGRDSHGRASFSITPIKHGDHRQDALAYRIECEREKDSMGFIRTFSASVEGWESDHTSIWFLAQAFANAASIVGSHIDFTSSEQVGRRAACVYEYTSWIRAILWGPKHGPRIAIQLYIQEEQDPTLFRSFFIRAIIKEAVQFGLALETEMIAACPKWASEMGLA